MTGLQVLILIGGVWIATVLLFRGVVLPYLRNGPNRSARLGAVWRFARAFVWLRHHPRYEGLEALRDNIDAGPLVLVANHTGAVDPFLIQSGCRFKVRWIMATEQMYASLDWLWKLLDVIAVERDGRDMAAARVAIRHVRGGGTVGIFPEGRVVHPPGRIWPFLAGVGLIVAKAKAPVLLAWVSETPPVFSVNGSLFGPSDSRVRFLGPIEYDDDMGVEAITEDLRRRLQEMSGWPLVDETPPPVKTEPGEVLSLGS